MQLSLTSFLVVLSLAAPLKVAADSISVCISLDITTPSDPDDFPAQQDFATDLITTISEGVLDSEFGALTFGTPVSRISTAPELFDDADETISDIMSHVPDGGQFRTTVSAVLACNRFLTREAMGDQLVMVTLTDGEQFRGVPLTDTVENARDDGISLVGVAIGDGVSQRTLDDLGDEGLTFSVGTFDDLSDLGEVVGQAILDVIGIGEDPGTPLVPGDPTAALDIDAQTMDVPVASPVSAPVASPAMDAPVGAPVASPAMDAAPSMDAPVMDAPVMDAPVASPALDAPVAAPTTPASVTAALVAAAPATASTVLARTSPVASPAMDAPVGAPVASPAMDAPAMDAPAMDAPVASPALDAPVAAPTTPAPVTTALAAASTVLARASTSEDPVVSVCIALDTTAPSSNAEDFAAQQSFATSLIGSIDMSLPAEFTAITFGTAIRRVTSNPVFNDVNGAIDAIDTHVPRGGNFRSISAAVLTCRRDFSRLASSTAQHQFIVSITDGPAFRSGALPREVRRARNRGGIQFIGVGVGSDAEVTADILSDNGMNFQVSDFSDLADLGPVVAAVLVEAALP